jgi:hypothetical protein
VRKVQRTIGIVFWSLFSVEIVIGILDWAGRWDFLKSFLMGHPRFAAFVRSPFAYLALFVFGLLFLKADRLLKQPRLLVRLIRSQTMPDENTTPLIALLDSELKAPGWDDRKLDWHTFLEFQVTNESENSTTISGVEALAVIRRGWFGWWRKEKVEIKCIEGFGTFVMDVGFNTKGEGIPYNGKRYRQIPNLLEELRDVPLERGIGHRGWLHLRVPQVCQKDVNSSSLSIDIWLVDAFGGKHKMENDKKPFDTNFLIFDDKDGLTR